MVDVGGMAGAAAGAPSAGQYTAREVSVLLQGNTGEYQDQMQQAADATNKVVKALEMVDRAFKASFKALGVASTGMGAAMTGMAASSTMVAASFEDAFARVEKTTGLAGNDIQKLGEEIRKISTEIPVAVGPLSELADLAGTLGVEAQNVALFAKVGAQLGAATNIGAGQAVASLANLITNFDMAQEEVEGLASAFAELSNHTRATESDILGFSQRVAGTAATVGMTAEEVLGWGAAITASGTQVELGSTAFSQTMLKIERSVATGSDEMTKFAKVVGMTREQFRAAWEESPSDVMLKFVNSLGAEGENASVTLDRLGMTGMGMSQTFLNMSAAGNEVNETLGKSNKAFAEGDKALRELAEVRFTTLIMALKTFRQSISEVIRSMGMVFLPVVTKVVEGLTWMVNLFNRFPQTMKDAVGIFMAVAGGLLTILGTVSLLIAAFHIFFAAVVLIPKAIGWLIGSIRSLSTHFSALQAQLVALKGQLIGTSAALTGLGATSAATAGQVGFLTKALGMFAAASAKSLKWIISGVGTYAFKEFGHAVMNLGKGAAWGLGRLASASTVLLIPLAKLLAIGVAIYVAYKGFQWLFNQAAVATDDAASSLENFADAAGLAYKEFDGLAADMEEGVKTAKEFTDANRDLLSVLNEMSALQAEDFLQVFAINLLMQGNDPEEVKKQVTELADRIEVLDGRDVDINFSADGAEQVQIALDQIADAAEMTIAGAKKRSITDWLFSRPDEQTRAQIGQQMQTIRNMAAQEGGSGAAIAGAFQMRENIDLIDDNLTKNKLLAEWNDMLKSVFPAMSDELNSQFQNLMANPDHITFEDFMEVFLSKDAYGSTKAVVDPIREALEGMGHDLDNISGSNAAQVLQDLAEVAPELTNVVGATGDLADELTAIRLLWEKGSGLTDEAELRRFQEAMLESHVATVGHKDAIADMQEELAKLADAGQEWGKEAELLKKHIEETNKAYSDIRFKEIESMIQAGDAARAVRLLRREMSELDMSLPGSQRIFEQWNDRLNQAIGTIEGNLRSLVQSKEAMDKQIADVHESTRERISEMTKSHHERMTENEERHNERMAEMAVAHNERIADIHKRRDEALKTSQERYQERLKSISEQEREAIKRMGEDAATAFDPMKRLQSQPTGSTAGVSANIAQQNVIYQQMVSNLNKLRQMGMSDEIIEAMGLDDPKNFAQVERTLLEAMANPGTIQEINNQWNQRLEISKAFAENNKSEIVKQYTEMRSEAAKEFAKSNQEINAEHAKSLQQQAQDYAENQRKTQAEFAKSQQKTREEHAKSVAKTNEEASKQTAKISEEMQKLGQDVGDTMEELIAKGFDSNIEGIVKMAQALQDAIIDTSANIEQSFGDIGYVEMRAHLALSDPHRPTPQYPPSHVPRGVDPRRMQHGGVATDEMLVQLAERSHEAVIPLNQQGADVIGRALGPYMAQALPATPMNGDNGLQRAVDALERMSMRDSNRTEINVGELRAHDYNDFRRQLENRQRQDRLAGLARGTTLNA